MTYLRNKYFEFLLIYNLIKTAKLRAKHGIHMVLILLLNSSDGVSYYDAKFKN